MTTGRINQITILILTSSHKGRSKQIVGLFPKKNEFSQLSTESSNISLSRTQRNRISFKSARVNVIKYRLVVPSVFTSYASTLQTYTVQDKKFILVGAASALSRLSILFNSLIQKLYVPAEQDSLTTPILFA